MRLLRLPFLLIFLGLSPLFCYSLQLQCYHCINRLTTSGITEKERNMLKLSLFRRFNIPPSSEYCELGGSDILFRTVPKEVCPGVNDTCVRIVLDGDESKKIVLRGCQSTIGTEDFNLRPNQPCDPSDKASAECMTTCQQPLCNTSHGFQLIFPFVLLLILAF